MADKNQLKIAPAVDLADDDPFAELTRIMGFDPRQPARQPAPAAVAPVPAEPVYADDFSLDLEKELLGEFELDDQHVPTAGDPALDFAGEATARDAAPADMDFDFSGAFDDALAAQEEFSEPAPAAVQDDELADVDFDLSGAFDAPLATSDGFEPPMAAQAQQGHELPDVDFDFSGAFDAPPAAQDMGERAPAVEFDDDLDAAFAAVGDQAAGGEPDFTFDLDDGDIGAPDALPVTPEAVALHADIADDLDAAIADFAVDGPAEAFDPAREAAAAPAPADDFDLFDESACALEDEAAPVAANEAEPAIDESAFRFDDDVFSLDEAPAEEAPRPEAAARYDDLDFAAHSAAAAVSPVVAEADLAHQSAKPAPASFELAVPPYVPRKLPTSPMDIAAEEFRNRASEPAPAEPAFNLEDELNALLGNSKAAPAPVPAVAPASARSAPEPSAFAAFASSIFKASPAPAPAIPAHEAPEPVGFHAPASPADIDDNLDWDFDAAGQGDRFETYADEPARSHQDSRFDDAPADDDTWPASAFADDAEPIDLDDVFDELSEDATPAAAAPAPSYRDAFAGAAVGAASARFDSGFAARPFEAPQPRQQAAQLAGSVASPHRDPVVRGNPMKEDPLDIITQLAEKYSKKEPATPYGRAMSIASGAAPAAYRPEDDVDGDIDISDVFDEPQPDIETIEVDDRAIALADDLDIPELPEDEAVPAATGYDDLDAEFSSLINDMNAESQAQQHGGQADPLAGGFSARPYENAVAATQYGARPAALAKDYRDEADLDPFALAANEFAGNGAAEGGRSDADDYQYDPDFEPEIAAHRQEAKPRSRGLLLAGLIGGVALVGGIGAFALSFGGGEDAPAIVKADEGPVKVRPENPGGVTVPNQDSKVYETVAGDGDAGATQQEKLVTTAEEPVDVTPPAVEEDEPAATASGKSEDRIEQIVQDAETKTDDEIAAVAPRKVRTMVVKPDGTLVPREDEPAAAGEPTQAVAAATPQAAPAPAVPESTGALPGQDAAGSPPPALAPAPGEPAAAALNSTPAAEAVPDEGDVASVTPETAPIAPLRPADQPVDVVGEVAPNQGAAATSAAGGGWAMQIASQPSEAAAQSSYQDLARRYGGVLQGREVNIVKAEIQGKGTFWRVRVPAASRNEAISLCESYKSAGGNCFVSR